MVVLYTVYSIQVNLSTYYTYIKLIDLMNSTVLLFDIWLRYFECMSLWCSFYYKIFKLVQHGTEYSFFFFFTCVIFHDKICRFDFNLGYKYPTKKKKLFLFRLLQLWRFYWHDSSRMLSISLCLAYQKYFHAMTISNVRENLLKTRI